LHGNHGFWKQFIEMRNWIIATLDRILQIRYVLAHELVENEPEYFDP